MKVTSCIAINNKNVDAEMLTINLYYKDETTYKLLKIYVVCINYGVKHVNNVIIVIDISRDINSFVFGHRKDNLTHCVM